MAGMTCLPLFLSSPFLDHNFHHLVMHKALCGMRFAVRLRQSLTLSLSPLSPSHHLHRLLSHSPAARPWPVHTVAHPPARPPVPRSSPHAVVRLSWRMELVMSEWAVCAWGREEAVAVRGWESEWWMRGAALDHARG
jgi:hypothetical protein